MTHGSPAASDTTSTLVRAYAEELLAGNGWGAVRAGLTTLLVTAAEGAGLMLLVPLMRAVGLFPHWRGCS